MKRSRSSSRFSSCRICSSRVAALPRACAGMPGDDQLVLQRVFPADEFGHRQLIATRFELQAAQGVGQLAAEFAGVDRMPPDLRQRRLGEGLVLLAAQLRGDFGLAAGDENDELRLLLEREANGVVGGGVAGVQRGDDVDRSGKAGESMAFSTHRLRKDMRVKPSRRASWRERSTSSGRASTP
jgi:hypothetical protein